MAMKYQKGTVYLCGEKVKMWYGKYLIYGRDQDGRRFAGIAMFGFVRGRIHPSGKPSNCCGRSF